MDPDWDDARIEEWKAANPDATKVTGDARIHWVTSVLATGQLLDNRPHWFQDQRFNCEVLNLMMIDGKPVSVLGFAAANWHLAAIAKTEHIHQLRLDNGNPLVMQEGSIVNAQNVEYEVSRPRGKIIVKQGKDVRSAITRLDANRSTQAWSELYAETRETNDRLTVDSNVEGGSQSSQESSKVVMARVNQQSNKYSRIYENANNFYLRLDKLIIRAAQRLIKNDYMVMNWIDPKTQENKQVEVNVPDPNDINTMMGEEPSTFLNRLDLTDYDVVMAEADNSTTGKAAELSEFVQIMQVVGQSVPPEYQGEALSQVPNQICRMIGEQIKQAKQAAQQAPPPPPPKVSATFDMSKLAFNPTMQDAAQQLVGLKPPSPPAPTAPAAQPGMEAPQPQGDMGQSPMPPMDVPAPAGPGVSAPEQPQPGEMNQ